MKIKRCIMVFVIVILGLNMLGCSNKEDKVMNEKINYIPVEVTEVKPSEIGNQFFTVSFLEAKKAILAQSSIQGTVKKIFVKLGDVVNKGKPLFEVDGEDLSEKLELSIKQADTELKRAQVTYENVEKEFNNMKQLYSDSLVSKSEYNAVEEELKNAMIDLELAKKNYSTALVSSKANLKKLIISSPIKGVVADISVKEGELLGVESGIKIITDDQLICKVSVTEDLIDKIEIGTVGKIHIPSIDKSVNCKVVKINEEIDPISATYGVTLEMDNKIESVKAGMYVEVTLDIEKIEGQILVPQNAVILKGDKTYIYKLIEEDKVKKVFVEKGIEVDGKVQITGDITFGECIVTKGQHFINEESKIEIVEKKD